jgi:GT2 family glycosyltransferase
VQPTLSLIIVCRNEGAYLRRTVKSLVSDLPSDAEIIVVDDGSTDGSSRGLRKLSDRVRVFRPQRRLGISVARNFGAGKSSGSIVIFSDAHVEALTVWARPLLAALSNPKVGAAGPILTSMLHPEAKGYGLRFSDAGLNVEWLNLRGAEPYPVPLLGGFFLALRREVFDELGGFDPGMGMYGMEDLELCVRLWTFGYKCVLVPSVDIAHLDREDNAYPDYQRDWKSGVHNFLRLAFLHFGRRRIRRVVGHYAKDKILPIALSRLVTGDVWDRRREFHDKRRFDDDWYFRRFNMEL